MTFTSIHTAAFSLPLLLRQKENTSDTGYLQKSVFAKPAKGAYLLEIVSAGLSTPLRKAMVMRDATERARAKLS